MTAPDVRQSLLQATAVFLDPELTQQLQAVLPGMDYQAIRQLFDEVDNTHQRINKLRLDILTLVSAEYERQGIENATEPDPTPDEESDESE